MELFQLGAELGSRPGKQTPVIKKLAIYVVITENYKLRFEFFLSEIQSIDLTAQNGEN